MSAPDFIVTGDGCRIAYRFDGDPDRPVLLLSNSLGTTLHMWDAQIPALADRFHILRYDSRGHGRSDAPAGAYSLDRLGRDVVELLDTLELASVRFCGLSKGGMVGQWLGIHALERIERLALCNTSSHMGPASGWNTRIATVRTRGMQAIAGAVVERWFTPAFQQNAPADVAHIRGMLLATDPAGYAGCCAAIRDMDMRRTAALIQAPTLVIAGTQDPATPAADGEQLTHTIPHARLSMLHAAHLSNVEQPHAFSQALLMFMDP